MGREVFQYKEVDSNDFLRVNQSTIFMEFFHTATYTTAADNNDTTVPVANMGGFTGGDGIYIGTTSTTMSAAAGTEGAGDLTVPSTSWSNNDAVILHTSGGSSQRATYYDDPSFSAGGSSTAAIELDEKNADAIQKLGALLGNQGNHQQAHDYFQKLVTLQPDLSNGWVNLGVAQEIAAIFDFSPRNCHNVTFPGESKCHSQTP